MIKLIQQIYGIYPKLSFFIYHLAQRRARRSIRVIRAIRVSFFISHRFHSFFLLPFVIYHLAQRMVKVNWLIG